MRSFHIAAAVLAYISIASANPTKVLQERDGPADPPGSVLATPAELPSYAPTASLAPLTLSSKFQWQIYKSCSDENRAAINQAWADSKEMSDALASYKLKSDYQPAMDTYMGDRSTYTNYFRDPPWDFPLQISRTINKHQGLYEGKSETGNANLWVYCNEDSFWFSHCTGGDNPTSAVIAYEQEDNFFNNWYITFCPQFYNASWVVPFQQKKKDLMDFNPHSDAMESYEGTQGYVFFHESMHMSQLVTSPQAVDKAYGAKDCYDLAKNRNTDAAVYNADSWSLVALAIWAQKTFNLANPPIPATYLTPAVVGITSESGSVEDDVMYVDASGVVPQGASPVPAGQDYFVNTTLWEIQDPAGGPPPSQSSSAPSQTSSAAPPPSSAPPAYATGTCSFHLRETQDCDSMSKNLFAIINLKDGAGNDIGDTSVSQTTDPIGMGINDGSAYSFNSKLPNPLVVTGEHENDYIQFTYGGLSWQSKTPNGGGHCNNGGWDPRDGPICGFRFGNQNAVNNMDCFFPC